MNKTLSQLFFALALLSSSAVAVAQSATDAGQDAASDAAIAQEDEEPAQAQQGQNPSSQDVAQVEEEEDATTGRFIPTEQLSQDLGASFPVDI
jgi:hypothetical protein